MQKNFYGLALYNPKTAKNVGSLIRTSHILGVSNIFIIGSRYKVQASDTTNATRTAIPTMHFDRFEEFTKYRLACPLVGVELTPHATLLQDFKHPRSCIYILGAEDNGLPVKILNECQHVIKLSGEMSMNVAVASSIVLYDRYTQINS